jgi:hypothetical protein
MRDISAMSLYHNSKHKLSNVRRTIASLLDSDFPLTAGDRALRKLTDVFEDIDSKLDRAASLNDQSALQLVAENLNLKIYQALPILGFILRSTNVRNAFEMLYPLYLIAKGALQGNPQLILSSEWDYVPFAYPQSLENLKSFILIGLPASEAASALLMPLAGHELGHAVWRNRGIGANLQLDLQSRCDANFRNKISDFQRVFSDFDENDLVARDLLPNAIAEASNYAGFQAEEIFSDLFAYGCFGESYLRAFAYILTPGGTISDPKYPMHSTRVDVMRSFAQSEAVALPAYTELGFKLDQRSGSARLNFIVRMAEAAVADITSELWSHVRNILEKGRLPRPTSTETEIHIKNFDLGIPSPQVKCVGDIINAGWRRFDNIAKSSGPERAADVSEKLGELNEILLKTIEVFEYRNRIS